MIIHPNKRPVAENGGKERNVLFNATLNTLLIRLYDVRSYSRCQLTSFFFLFFLN